MTDDYEYLSEQGPKGEGEEAFETHRPSFRRFYVTELWEFRRRDYIVKGVLHRGDLGVIYGAPAAGKSFVVNDLLAHIATGKPWNGHRVRKGKSLYVALEGENGLALRFAALVEGMDDDSVHAILEGLGVTIDDLDLLDRAAVEALIGFARKLELDVLVIDPFQNAIAGESDSESCTVSGVVQSIKRIRDELGCAVLLVHHAQKANAKVERGSSALRASCDLMLLVEDGTPRKLIYSRIKDGRVPDPRCFELHEVVIETDDEGDAVSSARVEWLAPKPRRGNWLPRNEMILFDALRYCRDETQGVTVPQIREDTGLGSSSTYAALHSLEEHGFVARSKKRPARYWATEAGLQQLSDDVDPQDPPAP